MSASTQDASIFSRIVAGEIPCYRVAENDRFIAFLDIQPLALGHTLAVPKQQLDYLFDYDDSTLASLMLFSKKVAMAIREEIPCQRIGVAVVGFEVPHAHVHLVPINQVEDLNFANPRLTPSEESMSETAGRIANAFKRF